jgi:hypothetical protein
MTGNGSSATAAAHGALIVDCRPMTEPTMQDVDTLIGPATPHFAYQIRQRLERLVAPLPADHPVRRHADERLRQLDQLGHTNSKAERGDPSAPRQ